MNVQYVRAETLNFVMTQRNCVHDPLSKVSTGADTYRVDHISEYMKAIQMKQSEKVTSVFVHDLYEESWNHDFPEAQRTPVSFV